MDRLPITWKSDLSNKIKQKFFQAVAVSVLLQVLLRHLDSNKTFLKKKARWELHKDTVCFFKQILEEAPHKTADVRPLASYLTNHQS